MIMGEVLRSLPMMRSRDVRSKGPVQSRKADGRLRHTYLITLEYSRGFLEHLKIQI